jgi:hypothetical protein
MQPIIEEFMDTLYPGALVNRIIDDKEFGPLVNGKNNTHEAVRYLTLALVSVARANCLDEEELGAAAGRIQLLTTAIVDLLDRPIFTNPTGYRDLIRQQQMRLHESINKNGFLYRE